MFALVTNSQTPSPLIGERNLWKPPNRKRRLGLGLGALSNANAQRYALCQICCLFHGEIY